MSRLIKLAVGLCQILIIIDSVLIASNVVSAKEKEGFDVSKLIEYNSLASCIAQIHKDFAKCNTNGAEKAKSTIGQIDLGEEWGRMLKCCGMWKLRDCWMKSARVKCTKDQADQIYSLPSLFMPELATECHEYTPESGKCSIPVWMIASIGSVVLIILGVTIFGCFVCVRKIRQKNQADMEARNNRLARFKNQKPSLTNGSSNGKANGNGQQAAAEYEKKPITNGVSHASDL